MFKGYKLDSISFGDNLDTYYNKGIELYNMHKNEVKQSLTSFLQSDKSLDGTQIINNWFPQINANIFISHSHKDEKTAIALAGWLFDNFNIKSFIDSCIWGFGDNLIQMLDNEYSWMDKANNIYYYNKVLQSSSHVHMMLSSALSNMIYETECLIFYNTPNSIEPFGTVDKTDSPWIYSEIAFSQIVKQTIPHRINKPVLEILNLRAEKRDHIEKSLKIKYDVDSKHLKNISAETLAKWVGYPNLKNAENALDKLYEITFPLTKFNI